MVFYVTHTEMMDSKMLTFFKVLSHCSWIKRLFDNNLHQWKVIPIYLVRLYSGKKFEFHFDLEISCSV